MTQQMMNNKYQINIKYKIQIKKVMNPKSLILTSLLIFTALTITCMDGCTSCSNQYTCLTCEPGSQCCYETCTNCINQTICTQCQPPYVLNATSLICMLGNCPVACADCNSATGICNSCDAGSMIQTLTNQCLPCPGFCETCSTPQACTTCLDRYFLNQNLTCTSCPSNCFFCKNASTCSACAGGYYLNQGKCIVCTSYCQSCTSALTCSQCSVGYYLNTNQQCLPCQSSCRQCIGSNSCSQCNSGYGLISGNCINCQTMFPSCTSCQQVNNQVFCQTCQSGFYLSNKVQCIRCIDNCDTCINANSCSLCIAGYFYNGTVGKCTTCPQSNCLLCPNGVSCTACAAGTFVLTSTSTCELCSSGCDQCSSQTFCLECSEGHYQQGNLCYQCAPECTVCFGSPYVCSTCIDGFYLDNYSMRCLPCPDFCPQCIDSLNCKVCSSGYYLTNNQCQACSTSDCYNCLNNKCTLCNPTYFLNGQVCDLCPLNCDICSSGIQCQSCHQGYYLNATSLCNLCESNCGFCASDQTCTSCLQGYYLKNGDCQACPESCFQCISLTQCTSCLPGRYLQYINGISTGTCEKCLSPCQTCSSNQTTCSSCTQGYYLSESGVCSQCKVGCLGCNSIIGCLVCKPGYIRMNAANHTTTNRIQYFCLSCPTSCLTCMLEVQTSNFVCTQCFPGYTVTSTGGCFPCGGTEDTVGCQQCTDQIVTDSTNHTHIAYTCKSCLPGFMINSTTQLCVPDEGGQSSGVFYIICIVALSIGCAILIGMITFNCCKKEESGMYREIS